MNCFAYKLKVPSNYHFLKMFAFKFKSLKKVKVQLELASSFHFCLKMHFNWICSHGFFERGFGATQRRQSIQLNLTNTWAGKNIYNKYKLVQIFIWTYIDLERHEELFNLYSSYYSFIPCCSFAFFGILYNVWKLIWEVFVGCHEINIIVNSFKYFWENIS